MNDKLVTYVQRKTPFLHVQIEGVLIDFGSRDFLPWIDAAIWRKQDGRAHSFWSLADPQRIDILSKADLDTLSRHHDFLQYNLDVKLLSTATIDIFKLEDGDGIGIHDDAGLDCVRVVSKLHQDAAQSTGGEFVLLGASMNDACIYPLEPNYGIGFAAGSIHLHAISNISGAPALFLVVQFLRADL